MTARMAYLPLVPTKTVVHHLHVEVYRKKQWRHCYTGKRKSSLSTCICVYW